MFHTCWHVQLRQSWNVLRDEEVEGLEHVVVAL
jgi:hypothetical protein